ncbi:MAG: fused MFS/spermidine synthase [Bryobacteraceae bacterium]
MRTRGIFPLLLLLILFSASGMCALIYEVVWYQLLQLAIGSTSVSLGILLATFMGGLCIGSIWFPRIGLKQHPLKIYAALELGIAACAVLVQLSLPSLNRLYIAGAEHGMPGMLLRGILAALCMLPATILMGASLPSIVRWAKSGVSWWGYLYAGNTAGAVIGCLLAGFYLLRIYDMATATYFAAAVNVGVACVSWLLASRLAGSTVSEEPPEATAETVDSPRWPVFLAIGLSGATALGAEVVWTRLLSMLLLGTVYVFSIILAVFLVGLAIGGGAGSWLIKRVRPQLALGWCQILLLFGFAWSAYMIVDVLPFWRDNALTTPDPWQMYFLDLKRVILAILPPTLFWGASFPLACAAIARSREDSGRTAGAIYAANTLGGIAGALAVSLLLIPRIGSQQSERVLLIAAAVGGVIVLFPILRRSVSGMAGLAASIAVALLLAWSVDPVPGELIAYGRRMAIQAGQSKVLYAAEGINSSVAITEWPGNIIYVNVNGHVEATTETYDMKLQRMVGHLPALLHPNPKSVLGIGFGAGVSAGTFTRYPSIQKITICEIEPLIPPASTRYFGDADYHVALDPRTHIVFDDARHYLLTTTDKFDIIASDPLDVFIKGTAALYSKEYFESVKNHLNPGGMFTLYVPLYETDEPTIKSELATFFDAFPYGTIWANTRNGQGYDMVFMGQVEPLRINIDETQERITREDHAPVRESLREIGVNSLLDLFSTYAGNAPDLAPWTAGAALNSDGNLRLSYLAGWGINSVLEDPLYRKIVGYRTSPVGIFTGSPAYVQRVLRALTN